MDRSRFTSVVTRSRIQQLAIITSIGGMVLLGSWRLPWYDERFTILLTRLSYPDLLTAIAGDVHPPLYYLLARFWMQFIPTGMGLAAQAFWLRMLSVLFTIGSIITFSKILPDFSNVIPIRYRKLLVTVFAVNGMVVYFAVEGRMYALLLLLTLLVVYLGNHKHWVLLAVVNLATLYTHNYALFYLPVTAFYLWLRHKEHIRHLILAYALPILGFLPWAWILYRQTTAIHTGYWLAPPRIGSDILATLNNLAYGPEINIAIIPATAVTTIGLGWLLYSNLRQSPRNSPKVRTCILLAWLTFMPMVIAVIVSYLVQPVWLWRGMIGVVPWLLILLWCSHLQQSKIPLAWITLIAPLIIVGSGITLIQRPLLSRNDIIPELLASEWEDGDIVYTVNDGQSINILASLPTVPLYQMPDCPDTHDRGALSPTTRASLGIHQQPLNDISYQRAWVIYDVSHLTDPCNLEKINTMIDALTPYFTIVDNEYIAMKVFLLEK